MHVLHTYHWHMWNNVVIMDQSVTIWYLLIKKNCELYCPLECKSILLEFSATTSNFPSKEYGELLKNFDIMKNNLGSSSISFDEITKNILALNIYFNDLEYTQMKRMRKMILLIWWLM